MLLGKEPSLTCLADGTLLLLTQHGGLFRSLDGGAAWAKPQCEPLRYTRNILPQLDGGLLLFDDGPSRVRSTDGGQTWPERESITVASAPGFRFGEASIAKLSEQDFLAAVRMCGEEFEAIGGPPRIAELPEFREIPPRHECTDHMVLLESEDQGRHWSKPRSFLGYGEVHAYLLLRDGRLLATYSNYHLPFGTFAVLTEDNGQTWDTDHPIQLSMSLTAFTGWANSVQLGNDDILTAYAITAYLEGEGHAQMMPGRDDTAAEVVRWRLPPPGECYDGG